MRKLIALVVTLAAILAPASLSDDAVKAAHDDRRAHASSWTIPFSVAAEDPTGNAPLMLQGELNLYFLLVNQAVSNKNTAMQLTTNLINVIATSNDQILGNLAGGGTVPIEGSAGGPPSSFSTRVEFQYMERGKAPRSIYFLVSGTLTSERTLGGATVDGVCWSLLECD